MNELDTNQTMATAKAAIEYTLHRIKFDARIRYHMGLGTEVFEKLCKAYSMITGQELEKVKAYWSKA